MDRHRHRRSGGTVQPDTHTCTTLRAAIAASEATKEIADTINVPAGVINITDDYVIQSDITVVGASARTTIIDGGVKYRGFRITRRGIAQLSHLTIRDGAAGQRRLADGGGILQRSGAVALTTCASPAAARRPRRRASPTTRAR